MKCEDVQPLLTQYILGDLPDALTEQVQQHVENCSVCRALVRDLKPTLDLLGHALADTSSADMRLTPQRRGAIVSALPGQRHRRSAWVFRSHPRLAMAASLLFIVTFTVLIVSSLMPASSRARKSALAIRMQHEDRMRRLEDRVDGRVTSDYNYEAAGDDSISFELPEMTVSTRALPKKAPAEGRIRPGLDLDSGVTTYGSGAGGPAPDVTDATASHFTTIDMFGYKGSNASGTLQSWDASGEESGGRPAPDAGTVNGFTLRGIREAEPVAPIEPPASPSPMGRPVSGALTTTDNRSTFSGDAEKDVTISAGERRRKAGVVDDNGRVGRGGGKDGDERRSSLSRLRLEKEKTDKLPDEKVVAEAKPVTARLPLSHHGQEFADEGKKRIDMSEVSASVGGKLIVDRDGDGLDAVNDVLLVDEGRKEEEETFRPESDGKAHFAVVPFNPFVTAQEQNFSTFSIDVDTAAYTLARNYMRRGLLPPPESVRTEEFINFFDYGYAAPESKTFAVHTTYAPSPHGRGLQLLKIGVKGRRLGREEQRGAVLTVLVDTSGSMDKPDRMGLLKTSLKLLVNALGDTDEIALIQYDSHARLVLDHTRASDKQKIQAAIDAMQCGGSTNLEEGMLRGYSIAASAFRPGAENRVLLLSDGVANLGSGSAEHILQTVERYRYQGIQCSVFGFGMGTYDDAMLEALANKGNGNYAFVDSEEEARRLLVDDLGATLHTIASDVKIQVEFNPNCVKRYRQLGYENRQLRKEDFRNDAVDAGEVGSGQSVTALYEMDLSELPAGESLATVRVRYRRIDTGKIEEVAHAVGVDSGVRRFRDADPVFRLAAAVAEFAEILRESPHARGSKAADLGPLVREVAAELPLDTRIAELGQLVEAAPGLSRAGE